ncbi:MAG TPA: Rieske 2Fe-2S domain-containing protein [Halomicronema sp.]
MNTVDREVTGTLMAGGSDANFFDCKEVWYPVYYVEDLEKKKPNKFTILGRDIVIWWDKKGDFWSVFEDRCPHRLVPLSEGRINESGLLECPYHGWAFSGSGSCEFIPQQGERNKAEESQRSCASYMPSTVRQGLLFVYPGNPENASKTAVPVVDTLEDGSPEWICINTFRDLPYDSITLLENVIDASHVPYTHHGTVGNRGFAGPVELEVVESSRQGFKGVWQDGPRKGTLGRQDTTFIAPCLMWHDLTSKKFGRTLTVVYATPIRKGECRLFARFPFKFPSKIPGFFIKLTPRWYSHLNQNTILEDDQIFLHLQERYLEKSDNRQNFSKAYYLPTAADRYVAEMRSWMQQYKADPFPGETLPPALNKEQLLDRYHSHTKNCSSCSAALKTINKLKFACLVVLILALGITPLAAGFVGWFLSLVILVDGGLWLYLSKLEKRFYQGEELPSRNKQR